MSGVFSVRLLKAWKFISLVLTHLHYCYIRKPTHHPQCIMGNTSKRKENVFLEQCKCSDVPQKYEITITDELHTDES